MWGHGVLPTALPTQFSAPLRPALPIYLCMNVGLRGLLVVRLPAPFVPLSTSLGPTVATRVLSTLVPVSAPPTGLDECSFFNSLVVGVPYSSIFCQFWLFFVFKLLSFFWLCEEAQCVYLHLHLGLKSVVLFS